ncbi:MAG TPA: NADH-quinone oxidoreductase subunit NuoG [Acidimicrobiales bacterium]|nr:NADH-quinone oxidoreductase subunit NuoG [Acidimicrobiales bacterium]
MSEPSSAPGSSSSEVPVRLTRRPLVTESAVGTPPPAPTAEGSVTVTIDGRQVQARAGSWIIDAADEAGVYIPRFCYHPRMKPVGMCRMCLVEVEGPRGATLMPACYNAVSDGMEIRTKSEKAVKAQEGVLEFLLVNHPLDCPVCDKGGECPLQDQTLAYGPGETRFVEEKRHWEKPIPISDLVYLDRERCIQCGRCVRFADEVAGDPLIDFAERGDMTEVATFPDQPYSSYFSGNVVQICPVGALTSKTYRFKARPWDLDQVESTCTNCAVGCRTAIQSSSGQVSRLIGVDSDPVNWGWLCDKGRYAFPTGNDTNRLSVPMVRRGDELVEVSWGEALSRVAQGLGAAKRAGGGPAIGVIGGARLPNEDAYVWSKVARMVLGTDNVDAQLGDGVPAETILGLPRATIDQAAAAPVVITVGPDIKDELPVLYLRLRHAVRENGVQLVELTPAPTGLSPYAAETAVYRPGGLAAVAAAITSGSPVTADVAGVARETLESVRAHIDRAGKISTPGGPSVVVILGRPSLAESEDQVAAAARILASLPGSAFLSALRRSNVNGALDFGLAPGVLPGRVGLDDGRAWFEYQWGAPLPEQRGTGTAGMLADAARGRIRAMVLVGADPIADFPDAGLALRGVLGAGFVVAIDTHLTESARRADVVLPAAAWSERRGTFTNIEGRITWLSQLVTEHAVSWPDWMIASEISARMGVNLAFTRLEDIWAEIERVSPLHHGVPYRVFSGVRARDGVVVPADPETVAAAGPPPPLDPMADPGIASAELHKVSPTAMLVTAVEMEPEAGSEDRSEKVAYPAPPESGASGEDVPAVPGFLGCPPVPAPNSEAAPGDGLRLVSRRTMWDGGTQVQASEQLAGLAPEATVRLNPAVLAELGVAHGEKVRVRSGRGSLIITAAADPGVPAGSAVIPWNLPGGRAGDLIDGSGRVTEVTVTDAAGGDA